MAETANAGNGLLAAACLAGAAAVCLCLPVCAGRAQAKADLSLICDQAASEASRQTGVPVSVLMAISLTETGRKRAGAFRPWPWTVNMEGKGYWFDTEDDARAYVYREYRRGARSFDVGCFQINFKWHGGAFASIDEMFDPVANAVYAARFLADLHRDSGSWSIAAGAYHSRTEQFADSYRERFDRIHASLTDAPDQPSPDRPGIPDIPDIVLAANGGNPDSISRRAGPVFRVNRYPLLQTGSSAGLGSLVPLEPAGSDLADVASLPGWPAPAGNAALAPAPGGRVMSGTSSAPPDPCPAC